MVDEAPSTGNRHGKALWQARMPQSDVQDVPPPQMSQAKQQRDRLMDGDRSLGLERRNF
jgi:hypothetical protein